MENEKHNHGKTTNQMLHDLADWLDKYENFFAEWQKNNPRASTQDEGDGEGPNPGGPPPPPPFHP